MCCLDITCANEFHFRVSVKAGTGFLQDVFCFFSTTWGPFKVSGAVNASSLLERALSSDVTGDGQFFPHLHLQVNIFKAPRTLFLHNCLWKQLLTAYCLWKFLHNKRTLQRR